MSIRAKVIQAAGAGHAASATLRQALDHGAETVRGDPMQYEDVRDAMQVRLKGLEETGTASKAVPALRF